MNGQSETLSSYFPGAATQGTGIFSEMVSYGAPWTTTVGMDMDMLYFGYHSGIKCPSLFIENLSTNGIANRQLVAQLLYQMFGLSWSNLWTVMQEKYEPLQTYHLTEEIQRDENRSTDFKRDDTQNSSFSNSGTTNTTDKGGGTITVTTVGTDTASTYGFNSSEAVPINSGTSNGTNTTANDTTDTTEGTSSNSGTTEGTLSRQDKGTEQIGENITRTRSGNTGQHTTQELLRQEFNLWKWNFYKQVFKDVDSVIALLII